MIDGYMLTVCKSSYWVTKLLFNDQDGTAVFALEPISDKFANEFDKKLLKNEYQSRVRNAVVRKAKAVFPKDNQIDFYSVEFIGNKMQLVRL